RGSHREAQGRPRRPAEDTAQLPALDNARDPARRIAQQRAARTERQLPGTVAANVMRAMEAEERLHRRAVSVVEIIQSCVIVVFAQSPAPGIRERIREAAGKTL